MSESLKQAKTKTPPGPGEKIRKIKYESESIWDSANAWRPKRTGKKLLSCIQCGTCGSTCPLSDYMDYTPRKIMAMTREGFKDEVLHSFTIWLCASCYACTVRCPRQIHITDIMYTLKREAIAAGVYPKRYPIPIFSRQFFNIVRNKGRNSEGRLLLKFYLHTNPLDLIKQAWLGLRLIKAGRFSLRQEKISAIEKLKRLLNSAERREVRA